MFLQRDLSLAGEKPVDEDPRRVRMRPTFGQAHRPSSSRKAFAFFPGACVELVHRQTLSLCPWRVPTAQADGEFPLHQPVCDLSSVFSVGNIHGAKQPPDELRPQLRTVVKKYHRRAESSAQRILGDKLALPL